MSCLCIIIEYLYNIYYASLAICANLEFCNIGYCGWEGNGNVVAVTHIWSWLLSSTLLTTHGKTLHESTE